MSHDSHDMDMPDTVTSTEASHSGSLDGDYDDASFQEGMERSDRNASCLLETWRASP